MSSNPIAGFVGFEDHLHFPFFFGVVVPAVFYIFSFVLKIEKQERALLTIATLFTLFFGYVEFVFMRRRNRKLTRSKPIYPEPRSGQELVKKKSVSWPEPKIICSAETPITPQLTLSPQAEGKTKKIHDVLNLKGNWNLVYHIFGFEEMLAFQEVGVIRRKVAAKANVNKRIEISFKGKKIKLLQKTKIVTTTIKDDLILGSKPSKAIMDGNNCFASAFVHWPQDSKRFVLVIVKTSSKRGTIATLEHRLIDESDPVVLSLSHKKQQNLGSIVAKGGRMMHVRIRSWKVASPEKVYEAQDIFSSFPT